MGGGNESGTHWLHTHSVLQGFQNILRLPFVLSYTNCNELVDLSCLKDAHHQLHSVETTMKKI